MRNVLLFPILVLCALLAACGGSSTEDGMEHQTISAFCETGASMVQDADVDDTVHYENYAYTKSKEGIKTDGLTFFSFTQNTVTHTGERGEPLLLETLDLTSFYSQCPIQTEWVNEVLEDIQQSDYRYGTQLLEYAKQDHQERKDAFYCHSYYVSRGVGRHDNNVISLLTRSTVYSGGSQPNMVQTALNLDMLELRTLILEDVIKRQGCEELQDLVLAQVEEKFSALGQSALFENYRAIIGDALTYDKMTPNWYFSQKGLVIFFNPYTLAPSAAGIIKVELAYDRLVGILEEPYFPEEVSGWITNVSLDQERIYKKEYYDVKLGEGDTYYITISGKASSVQLSEVSFVENTAVSSTMLFSANWITDDTTLAVTGTTDPEVTYAVSYHDATGGPKVLYIRDNQIMTEIVN